MTSRDFCYWLQGILECGGVEKLNKEQVAMIKSHLALVFSGELKARKFKFEELSKLYPPNVNNNLMCAKDEFFK